MGGWVVQQDYAPVILVIANEQHLWHTVWHAQLEAAGGRPVVQGRIPIASLASDQQGTGSAADDLVRQAGARCARVAGAAHVPRPVPGLHVVAPEEGEADGPGRDQHKGQVEHLRPLLPGPVPRDGIGQDRGHEAVERREAVREAHEQPRVRGADVDEARGDGGGGEAHDGEGQAQKQKALPGVRLVGDEHEDAAGADQASADGGLPHEGLALPAVRQDIGQMSEDETDLRRFKRRGPLIAVGGAGMRVWESGQVPGGFPGAVLPCCLAALLSCRPAARDVLGEGGFGMV